MAFAAPFARPASSRFIRPGSASLWFAPRPFPALVWLVQRPTVPTAAVPGGSSSVGQHINRVRAGTEAGGPGALSLPAPGRQDAGGTRKARKRMPGEPPRLDMELRLLFSRYTPAPDGDFFTAMRIELGARAWNMKHAIGAPRPVWSPAPGTESDLEKRRARLVTEVHLGLAMVEAGPKRYPRPVRNVLLNQQAGHIGQRLQELLRHPGAGSLADELQRLLDALQRRR